MSDDYRLRIRIDQLRHELVCASGQCERRPVVTFSLPVGVEADDGDDDICVLRELDCVGHKLIGVFDRGTSKAHTRVTESKTKAIERSDKGKQGERN